MAEQRYEPLPGFDQLPAWLWRRTGAWTRAALAAALLLTIAGAIVLIPAIQEGRRERAAADRRQAAAHHAAEVRRLQAMQRPRFGRSTRARPVAMVRDLEAAILADARERTGSVLRTACEPFPRTVGEPPPERQPGARKGGYACLAVTAEIDRSAASTAGAVGHPYRAALDFTSGRYAFCKVAGRPDPIPDPEVVTPAACTG